MKKLFAIMLALVLALSAVSALAEATEMNWSAVEAEAAQLDGQFYTLEGLGVAIWLPAALQPVELSEEDVAAGYIAYFTNEDQSFAVAAQYVDVNGASLEDYSAMVSAVEGVTGVEAAVINGLPAVGYMMADTATSSVAFATEAGYILEFSFGPLTSEEFAPYLAAMIMSIQTAE